MSNKTDYGTCLMRSLLFLLIGLIVIFVIFFSISALFNLGVWDEFWDLIAQRTGWDVG